MAKKDTSKKDEGAAKKAAPKKAAIKELNATGMYTFMGNGIAPSLKSGMMYKVTGYFAAHYIKMGFGEIID